MATLTAPTNHSPNEDAEALRKAFEGVIIPFFLVYRSCHSPIDFICHENVTNLQTSLAILISV